MLDIAAAADRAASTITPASARAMPRRTFLAGLAKLPLVGGSVTLLGQPSAVAQPATRQMLEAYKTWLHYEQRFLAWDMAELPDVIAYHGGTRVHRSLAMDSCIVHLGTGDASRYHHPRASSPVDRAALVLSAVGCDWRDPEAPSDWLLPVRRADR